MNLTFYFRQMRRKQMEINTSCNVGKRRRKAPKLYTIDELNDDLDRHAMKLFALFFGSLVILVIIGCLK